VFTRDSIGQWSQQQKLLASDGADYDYFAESIALDGDTLVVGASRDDDNGSSSGSTYVFTRDSIGQWSQQQKLLASDGADYDYFGSAIALDGDTLVVGAYGDDDNGSSSGSAYVFSLETQPTTGQLPGVGLFDPNLSAFYLKKSLSTGIADHYIRFGVPNAGLMPLLGDWDGDLGTAIGLYDPTRGIFYLKNSLTDGAADITFPYGPANAGWIPLSGDWDGNGVDTVGLYDPTRGVFYLRNSLTSGVADITFTYGPANVGWVPLSGDWDGNGVDTVGLYNSMRGVFYLRNSLTSGVADITFTYGPANINWIPLGWRWMNN
jgi:hypothetical protein